MSSRSRCFGGGAGVLWLKRKRRSSAETASDPHLGGTESIEPSPPPSALTDPERIVSSPSTESSSSVDKDAHGDDETWKERVSPDSPSDAVLSPSPITRNHGQENPTLQSWTKPTRNRNKFGGKKRWVSLDQAVGARRPETMRPRLSTDESEPTQEDARFSNDQSDTEAETVTETTDWDCVADTSVTVSTVSQSSQSQSSSDMTCLDFVADSQSTQEVDHDFQECSSSQPGSLTSLNIAQRFFEQLDSEHPLVIEPNGTKSPPRSRRMVSGRSRRAVTVNDPDIQKDYQDYSAMCREAGVDPVAIGVFLRQCSMARGHVYDGFLDV